MGITLTSSACLIKVMLPALERFDLPRGTKSLALMKAPGMVELVGSTDCKRHDRGGRTQPP